MKPRKSRQSRHRKEIRHDSTFSLPLFAEFPLSSLFKIREERIVATLEELYPSCRGTKLIETCLARLSIYPLKLHPRSKRMEIGECGNAFCYTVYVPYTGDTCLWQTYPEAFLSLPKGETFRESLILAVRETSEGAAKVLLDERYEAVEQIITKQSLQIERFNKGLKRLIVEVLEGADGLHAYH